MGAFDKNKFFEQVLPYAQRASKGTNIPVSVIQAQWAIESAYGQSAVAVNDRNLGGIKKVSSSIAIGKSPSGYAVYKDYNQFVDDYIRVMNLSLYDSVRNATTIQDTVKALGGSKYAEGTYSKGTAILSLINSQGLTKYDGLTVTTPTPSTTTTGFNYNDIVNKVNNASAEDLKKWAIIGAGVIALVSLVK